MNEYAPGLVRDARDIEAMEQTPLIPPGSARCSYDALRDAAARVPNKAALRFFLDGLCHDPRRIPWRARARSLAAWARYGQFVARPYEEITFGQAARRTTQTARLLRDCGVGRGDVVSLLLPNLPETMICTWAAETVGIVNPVNPLLEPEIIESILISAKTKVLVTIGELAGSDIWQKVERLRSRVPTLRTVIVVRGRAPADCIRLERAADRLDASPLQRQDLPGLDDVSSLFHTGGTTGMPKLVIGTHRNKIANARMLMSVSPLTKDDAGLIALPMFHVNASINVLIGLLLGMTSVIAGPSGFRTRGVRDNFYAILQSQRISYFSAVPSVFAALLQPECDPTALASVRFAISAAAALPVDVMHAFTSKTGIRILEGYGQTEATVATCLNPYGSLGKPGSVGLRLPHSRVRTVLIGPDRRVERDCTIDEIGHLLVAGEHVSAGYLDPVHDSTLWVDDRAGSRWLDSGDLARIDDDGYVWLTGRAKELIIRGGHNIDPRMIEQALESHADVVMAAAVGRPDAHAGEVPVAFVIGRPGVVLDQVSLLSYARSRIPERAAWPKAIRIVDELPLTAIGKVFKPELTRREQEDATREALQPLAAVVSSIRVTVGPHALYGSISRIDVTLYSEGDRAEVIRRVDAAMGAFSSRREITIDVCPSSL